MNDEVKDTAILRALEEIQCAAQEYQRKHSAWSATEVANKQAKTEYNEAAWKLEKARRELDGLLPTRA